MNEQIQRIQSPSPICTREIFKLTLDTLRKCFDPGIHFNKFNVGENFIHLLDTAICGSYALSPEIRSKSRREHLEGKAEPCKTGTCFDWSATGPGSQQSELNGLLILPLRQTRFHSCTVFFLIKGTSWATK